MFRASVDVAFLGATISVLFIHTVSVLCLPHDASLCWQGGPSYNRKTLVGNWSEDLDSEDVSALGWVRDTDASAWTQCRAPSHTQQGRIGQLVAVAF